MNKKISTEEAKLIDKSLKDIITMFHEESVFYNKIHHFFEKNGIKKERIETVMIEIYSLNLMNRKNSYGDEKNDIEIHRNEIHRLLISGGFTSRLTQLNLNELALYEFPRTKQKANISLGIAIGLALLKLIEFLIRLYSN